MNRVWVVLAFVSLSPLLCSAAEQCGKQANDALCPNGLCCSRWGYCGTTEPYCGDGCQSNCWAPPPPVTPPPPPPPFVPPPPPGEGVGSIITSSVFEEMLPNKDSSICHARGFYTYDAFITAANSFSEFGTTGNDEARLKELAAFFGQTSHETTGGWPTAPGGPFAWGYCFKEEINPSWNYCDPSNQQYPCVPGKSYHGRGPMQLSHNANYGQAGEALGVDLLSNPDLVATDPVISFKTAIWFWMTVQAPKPSCHAVMIGAWTPSNNDLEAGRYPGYGLTTNIINGGLECGRGTDARVENRIGFYKRYCDMFGVSYGGYLDCNSMRPYGLTFGNLYLRIKQRLCGLWSL